MSSIAIGPVGMTAMACPSDELAAQELRFVEALERAATWEGDATSLVLRDAAGAMVLTFGPISMVLPSPEPSVVPVPTPTATPAPTPDAARDPHADAPGDAHPAADADAHPGPTPKPTAQADAASPRPSRRPRRRRRSPPRRRARRSPAPRGPSTASAVPMTSRSPVPSARG